MTEKSGRQFQIIASEKYVTLRLTGELTPEGLAELEAAAGDALTGSPELPLIVNFERVSVMHKSWIRFLVQASKELAAENGKMRCVLMTPALEAFVKAEGVDRLVKRCPTLRDALVELGLVTKRALDTDFINPFLQATMHVLKIQARAEARAGKPFLKQDKDKVSGDISGTIGLVSESFNGTVVITFPLQTFLGVMSSMFGQPFTELSDEIKDGVGELTNMIFGQAKISLNEKGYGIKTALPSVVVGKDHSVSALTQGPVVVIPFESTAGPFFVEVCLSG